ncbi:hypothetical protein [Pedobacter metabolipauper]|uniref:Uncharacterized protein n=1 Tax=Pedobacter metabolipauper TaxID=425513 RepID=A0A4R6T1B0_9SPHI|nr:hypothetical protein [Pedobacter metabolipauper]TDQ12185.1 hypothetical protein ATK78_1319 [Pedobacter metabolipauper]
MATDHTIFLFKKFGEILTPGGFEVGVGDPNIIGFTLPLESPTTSIERMEAFVYLILKDHNLEIKEPTEFLFYQKNGEQIGGIEISPKK